MTNTGWYNQRMENYPTIKRNEILIHTTTQRKFMLSERSQIQKITFYMTPFTQNIQERKIYRGRKQTSSCLSLAVGWGKQRFPADKHEGSHWIMQLFQNQILVMVAQLSKLTKNHRIICLKSVTFKLCILYFSKITF